VQYKTPFAPIMPGSVTATYLDLDSAAQAIAKGRTAAVFVEPIQGEGGVTPANTCVTWAAQRACHHRRCGQRACLSAARFC